jgi:hypothetical protein
MADGSEELEAVTILNILRQADIITRIFASGVAAGAMIGR